MMPIRPIRVTPVIRAVMTAILQAPPSDPAWGLPICEQTGYGPGTVYPVLRRLAEAGWITGRWEDPPPADRPKRRYYEPAYAASWYEQRLNPSLAPPGP